MRTATEALRKRAIVPPASAGAADAQLTPAEVEHEAREPGRAGPLKAFTCGTDGVDHAGLEKLLSFRRAQLRACLRMNAMSAASSGSASGSERVRVCLSPASSTVRT